jgi:hypothetical protein
MSHFTHSLLIASILKFLDLSINLKCELEYELLLWILSLPS